MRAVSADRFLDALRQSGLLATGHFDAQVRRSAAEGPPEDASELAERFVRDGLLTSYQANQLLQGKWQGLVIASKYAVLAPIGAGGMGQVFLTEHMVLHRRSAVKVLPARLTADPSAVERFLREAQAVAALDHPNIVRAYDIDNADDLHFLVMEYVDGVSLQELVGRLGPVAPKAAANYIAQAAYGLQHAHEAGWVHRDVKPANLLLDRTGTVKVLDLGLARMLGDNVEPLTGRLDALGTADYVAPEQGADSHAVDIRADIYSLGATLYFLLAGKPPFAEGTPAQKVLWHQTRSPRPIRELRPDVPTGLASILDRMLAKEPKKRYADPAAVAEALEPWTSDGLTYPPPADLASTAVEGARSGALSSWARHAGSSGSKATPAPGRKAATIAAETAASLSDTGRIAPIPPARPAIRRWPIIAGSLATAALATTIAITFWPKPRAAGPMAGLPSPADPVGEVQKFVGHDDAIENVAFSVDGRRLITTSQDTTIRIWDVATGNFLRKLTGHTKSVRGLAVLPDGHRIATAGWDGSVRLWEIDSGNEIRKYKGHTGQAWWVACDSDGKRLLSTGSDFFVRMWDVETGDELKRMSGHRKIPTAAVFLRDGQTAVSASEDWFLRMWDLKTGHLIVQRQTPKMLYRLSLSPNGRCVLCGCDNSFIRWTPPDGTIRPTTIPSSQPVESAVALPDGRIVLAIKDGTIRIWDSNLDQIVHQFQSNDQPVMALAVAPDGRHIASAGRDRIARIWRVPEK